MRFKLQSRYFMSCFVLAITPAVLSAQVKRDPIPPAPGITASPTETADPDDLGQVPRAPWFDHVGVREQLRLTDEQFHRLNRGYQAARNHYVDTLNKLDPSLTPDEFQQRDKLAYIRFVRDFTPTVREVFPTAEANRRYQQLYLQYRGYGAFSEPEVDKKLKLSAVQRQKLNEYDRDYNRQLSTWRRNYPKSADSLASEYNESRQEIETRTHALLSIEQQQSWHDLRGEPYDFSHEVYIPNSAATAPVTVVK